MQAVQRTWNGHDLSHMATRTCSASFDQVGQTLRNEQGWALHISVSRKMCLGCMGLSGCPETLLPHGICIDMGVPLALEARAQ